MGVNFELIRVLRKAQKPKIVPCAKDAGCVQATAAALGAAYRAMEKPRKELVDGDREPVIMCSWCQRIKEDGEWIEAEVFECEITHTICPDCMAEQEKELESEGTRSA